MSSRAWVTLATNDSYGLGALVLANSLRRVNSAYPAVVLITPAVTESMRNRLGVFFADVVTVDVLDSRDAAHLALLQRPELGITFTKIHCWNLTQYEKCVFLDADTLVVQNSDELFEREELSAAPDVGWPDCFNSGVFVFKPSLDTFNRLITFAKERGSFDGGDQGLLNSFFSDWAHGDINRHLPFLYNVTSAAFYSYIPALKHYGQNLKIIHFIGIAKPWLQQFNWESNTVEAPDHLREFLQLWWDLFVQQVHSQLDTSMVNIEEATTTLESLPQLPPEDRYAYYVPEIDPGSEFSWHRPENQVAYEELRVKEIDMSQFYDPWERVMGNIPPVPDASGQNSNRMEDNQQATDYFGQHHILELPYVEISSGYLQQHQTNDQDNFQVNRYLKDNRSDEQLVPKNSNLTSQQAHDNQAQNYQTYNYEQYSQNHHDQQQVDYSKQSHPHNSVVDCCYHSYIIQSTHHDHYAYSHNSQHSPGQSHTLHNSHDISLRNNTQSSQEHTFTYDSCSQAHTKNYSQKENIELLRNDNNREIDIKHKRCHRNNDCIVPMNLNKLADEDFLEINNDNHEDIIPRHPYDNFYLRHRSIIDSRGRKICTHEIPPTSSTSDSSPSLLSTSLPSADDSSPRRDNENQSGVAGNLARVVPGAIGSQREALDELTRRQGWEAGNIDYMGADSFDNIWAKISQTLSQPRTSPPKQSPPKEPTPPPEQPSPSRKESTPPKQLSPPKEQTQIEPKLIETPVSQSKPEPLSAPVNVATEAEESVPAPKEAPAPVEIPAVEKLVEDDAPASAKVVLVAESAPAAVISTPSVPVNASPATLVPVPSESKQVVESAEELKEISETTAVLSTPPVTPKFTPKASTPVTEAPPNVESTTPTQEPSIQASPETPKAAKVAPVALGTPTSIPGARPAPSTQTIAEEKDASFTTTASSDSPPLANTPSKDDPPKLPAAKLEERRKPAGKLQLSPPAGADPLPTPDSELEDAAALAQSIIASELQTPTVTAPSPTAAPTSPPPTAQQKQLSVEEPEVPTPPVGAVSLAQIGVKPSGKGKKTTAAQIESSVSEKTEPASPTLSTTPATPTSPTTPATPATPTTPTTPSASEPSTPTEAPKKKVIKKVAKKEGASSGDAPVPPPRKKEKKPKDK